MHERTELHEIRSSSSTAVAVVVAAVAAAAAVVVVVVFVVVVVAPWPQECHPSVSYNSVLQGSSQINLLRTESFVA